MNLIAPYFRENLLKILTGILCMILVDCAQLAIPYIIKQAVDILADSKFDPDVLYRQVLIIIILGIGMAVLRYCWRILLMGSARELETGIREQLHTHLLTLDPAFYNRVKTGDIMAHATSDINHIRMAFGMGIIALTDAVLLGSASIAIMMWMNPKLTVIALLPMPFLIVIIRLLGKKMHEYHTRSQEAFSDLTELVREAFSGIRILKLFNLEPAIGDKVLTFSRRYFKKNLQRATITAFLRPLMGFFFNLSTFIVLFYGGYLVIRNAISPGELVAFTQYLGILAWPVIALGWMTNLVQRGLASLKRINSLIHARPVVSGTKDAVPYTRFRQLTFSKVGFAYEPGQPALVDINFSIPHGSSVGITGPPGSGKTTLVQLIPRLYDTSSGQILFDNRSIKSMDLAQLRQQVAFMPQEPFLFSGTIKSNILMGREVPEERLDEILQECQLSKTLAQMPDGLDTLVGERGITLSGGQKQRIAMARTLIQHRDITILDDPVSQVDTHTAGDLITVLKKIQHRGLVIIVSHRISALAFCDVIFIMENGRIKAQGTHDTLLKTSAFYKYSHDIQQFEADNGT